MEINIAGGAYKTFSKNLNAEECINYFPVLDKTGGKTPIALRGTPGLLRWVDLDDDSEVRNVIEYSRWTYWVCGNKVYQVDTNGTVVDCTGDILETTTGYVWMSLNNAGEIMIVDGYAGYIIDGTTVTKITDTDFPSRPTSVAFQDGYFIITVEESGRIYISDLNDGSSWTSTAYGNAEARPDDSISLISDRDELIVLGEASKQSFQNTGATFPFQKLSGSTQSVGINAPASLVQFANTFFWLSDDLQFVQADGYGAKPISPPAIDYQIAQMTDSTDCVSFGYIQEGNAFLINQFKTDNQTWVYDVSTGFWHRRMSYPNNGRWRGNCYVYFAGKHLVGDHSNGLIYELDFDTFTDDGEEILRKRIPPVITVENKNLFHHELEIYFEPGVGVSNETIYPLKFDSKTGHFSIGSVVYGGTSGAYGTVVRVTYNETNGIVWLKDISGTFQNNEIIYEATYENELLTNGDFANWTGDDPDDWTVIEAGDATSNITENPTGQCQIISDGTLTSIAQDPTSEDGEFYRAATEIKTATSGSIVIQVEGEELGTYSTTGTKEVVAQADGITMNTTFKRSGATNITIDNCSVKRITNAALVNGTIGTGITDPAHDPQAMLRYSNNGGHTWSNEIWRSVGEIGEYDERAIWNRLGGGRNRNYEISMSAPVKWVILGANLEVEKGSS